MNEWASWVSIPQNSGFTLANLPYGIFQTADSEPRMGVAIGGDILDLARVNDLDLFGDLEFDHSILRHSTLNAFMALPKAIHRQFRERLIRILAADNRPVSTFSDLILVPQTQAQMLMPFSIGDYTDFYSSIEHATNVGTMFRGKDNALMPNWKHLPIAYHGRSSTIRVSPHSFQRPKGQRLPADAEKPVFGPSVALDFELEVAFVIGKPTGHGQTLSTAEAEEHIFGLVLFNDWSARDIQKWEYQPLGPFLGKNFASTISPWVVTLEALEPHRVSPPTQDPVLPYLEASGKGGFDIALEVELQTAQGQTAIISRTNHSYLYWTIAQQLAHHTCGGCAMNVGDLCASGTISGPDKTAFGSLLELTWGGKEPIVLPDGTTRTYLQDGDSITLRGYAGSGASRIGFGEAKATVMAAI